MKLTRTKITPATARARAIRVSPAAGVASGEVNAWWNHRYSAIPPKVGPVRARLAIANGLRAAERNVPVASSTKPLNSSGGGVRQTNPFSVPLSNGPIGNHHSAATNAANG